MDLSKVKPEKIKDDPIRNDEIGTLKAHRRWSENREKVIDALRAAELKIRRAQKIDKSVRKAFELVANIKKEIDKKKMKESRNLQDFLDHATNKIQESIYDKIYDKYKNHYMSLEDVQVIRDFVKYISPVVKKTSKDKDIDKILKDWQETLDLIVDNYPTSLDSYGHEIIRQILDMLYEFEDFEEVEYMDKLDMATSPFFDSVIDLARSAPGLERQIQANYEKY